MKNERIFLIQSIRWPRFFLRAVLFVLTLAVLAAVKLPGQVRGVAYGLYREVSRISIEYKVTNMPVMESAHFRVVYREKDAVYAGMVLEAAEKFYKPLAEKYQLKNNHKILVMIYPSREELNASFGWQSNESAIGVYYVGVIRVLSPASWIEEQDIEKIKDVFVKTGPMAHELTHLAVDYATRGNCPRWLTEGLAQLEEYRLTGFRFADRNDQGGFYSLKEMDKNFDDLADQSLAYRESLSVVEYINTRYGEESLKDILFHLNNGKTIDQAIKIVIGVDMSELEQKWRDWSGF